MAYLIQRNWSLSELLRIDYNSTIFILNFQNSKLKIPYSAVTKLKIPKIVGFMLLLNLQVLSIYLGLAVEEDKTIEHYMCAELVLVS